jgi:hypothetical protein
MGWRISMRRAVDGKPVVTHWDRSKQKWVDRVSGPSYPTFRGAYRIMNKLWLVAATRQGDEISVRIE